jgi:uncharacterized repeat protein (TIGR04138 family)
MRRDAKFWQAVEGIREKDSRFKAEAYALVVESLDFTMRRIGERRHVSAVELLRGFCDHAKAKYGLLAYKVIESWGVSSSGDVGRIVYQLIEVGVLSKQDSDRFEDFETDWNLEELLEKRYFE